MNVRNRGHQFMDVQIAPVGGHHVIAVRVAETAAESQSPVEPPHGAIVLGGDRLAACPLRDIGRVAGDCYFERIGETFV